MTQLSKLNYSNINNIKTACAILSFNHPEITAKTLNSVLDKHSNSDCFLIHNGSEQKWIMQHQKNFPSIHHLIIDKNKGFTGGVNFALSALFKNYDWVFLITNDCTLLTPLNPPESEGFYSPLIYRRKIQQIDSIAGLFWPSTGKLQHSRTINDLNNSLSNNSNAKLYIPGTAFWLHKNVFMQIGLFDESLHTYWEDVDYSVRVQNAGLNINHYANTELIHAIGKTCHKDSFYTQHLFHRNRKIVSLRYCKNHNEKFRFHCTIIIEKIKRKFKLAIKSKLQKSINL